MYRFPEEKYRCQACLEIFTVVKAEKFAFKDVEICRAKHCDGRAIKLAKDNAQDHRLGHYRKGEGWAAEIYYRCVDCGATCTCFKSTLWGTKIHRECNDCGGVAFIIGFEHRWITVPVADAVERNPMLSKAVWKG